MSNSRRTTAPLRGRRNRSTADKIISAGLATATCVGIVGVIGVRTIEASAAADSSSTESSSSDTATPGAAVAQVAVSSTGLTEAQLDEYAAQLAAEGAKLDAYRAKL
ncbi:MAG: hypothetical protein NTX29_05005, partial [Actinobacteria bacterium]|nr:hypothetical protein [Actinomycetota bacterium]